MAGAFLDIASKRWFNTLAELKSFQRGEKTPPSPPIEKEVEKVPVPEPVVEEPIVETVVETVEEEEEDTVEMVDVESDDEGNISTDVKLNMTRNEICEKLESFGVDRRSFNRKGDAALARMYLKYVSMKAGKI